MQKNKKVSAASKAKQNVKSLIAKHRKNSLAAQQGGCAGYPGGWGN